MKYGSGQLDIQHLIGEVAARHGILLKADDAAFALVTLNQLMLEGVTTELLNKVQGAVVEFEEASARVQNRAGHLLAIEVKASAAAIRSELNSDIATAGKQARELVLEVHRAHSRATREKWIALALASGFLLFVSGMLVGRFLR